MWTTCRNLPTFSGYCIIKGSLPFLFQNINTCLCSCCPVQANSVKRIKKDWKKAKKTHKRKANSKTAKTAKTAKKTTKPVFCPVFPLLLAIFVAVACWFHCFPGFLLEFCCFFCFCVVFFCCFASFSCFFWIFIAHFFLFFSNSIFFFFSSFFLLFQISFFFGNLKNN